MFIRWYVYNIGVIGVSVEIYLFIYLQLLEPIHIVA
jgi:hypothetical protein